MTSITVDNTTYQATEGQMAAYQAIDKKTLASQLAKINGKGVAFWRALPKEALVVVVAAIHEQHTDTERDEIKMAGGPDYDTRGQEGDDQDSGAVDPNPLAEDYPGQRISEPNPIVAPAPVVPLQLKGVAVGDANARNDKSVRYALQVSEGNYLRRDQPRKPGDTATYKVVPREQASVYTRYETALLKIAEAATLGQEATVVTL